MQWTTTHEEPGFKDLLKSLSRGFGVLLRQEVEFAKVEVSKQMAHARRGVVLAAVGGFLGVTGWLALITAAVVGLAYVMPLWLSALLIGLFLASLGGALLLASRNELKAENLKPQKTINAVKEDISWMKSHLS